MILHMAKIDEGRILGKHLQNILEAIFSKELDPVEAVERGYKELYEQYTVVGDDKSVLKIDASYSQDENRFEEILEYVEENYPKKLRFQEDEGTKKSIFRINYENMSQRIEEAQSKDTTDLGGLVKNINQEEIEIVSEEILKRSHPQLLTLDGCYEVLKSYSMQVTAENRGNTYMVIF